MWMVAYEWSAAPRSHLSGPSLRWRPDSF